MLVKFFILFFTFKILKSKFYSLTILPINFVISMADTAKFIYIRQTSVSIIFYNREAVAFVFSCICQFEHKKIIEIVYVEMVEIR